MGCDIHLDFERKDHKGIWKEVIVTPQNILPDERNYTLFAFLFNVRNSTSEVHKFSGRGIPLDCSIKSLIEDYENTYSDFHSWTYIYASELEKIQWPENL